MTIPELVQDLAKQVRDKGSEIVDEIIDSYINTAQETHKQEILDAIGDVDLTEPRPDLSAGWSRVRGQLAYNALYFAVCAELKSDDKPREIVRCQCGMWSGDPCQWEGSDSETVLVEYLPESLWSAHRAAGNHGTYPHNGAIRIRVERSCADRMTTCEPEWCEIL